MMLGRIPSGRAAMRRRIALVTMIAAGLSGATALAQSSADIPTVHPAPQGRELDLTKPFHAHSIWRFAVTEGPPVQDFGENDAPGALTLCLHKGPAGPCVSGPVTLPLRPPTPDYAIAWEPHYLITAKVVYPR